jgi:hypothetical protein
MKIPDYYRQFQSQPAKEDKETTKPDQEEKPKTPEQKQEIQSSREKTVVKDKTELFQANSFTLNKLDDWQDKTIYTLTGPVTDGIQHNVIINIDQDVPFEDLIDYAEWQIRTLEEELKGCTLLKKGETKLDNGMDAYEAIFSWIPVEDMKIYQHQIYFLNDNTAFKLTASFTKKTRQTIGPSVLRMMLSFNPAGKSKK